MSGVELEEFPKLEEEGFPNEEVESLPKDEGEEEPKDDVEGLPKEEVESVPKDGVDGFPKEEVGDELEPPLLGPTSPSSWEIRESTSAEFEEAGAGAGEEFEFSEGSFNRELIWSNKAESSCRKRFCPESRFPLDAEAVELPNPKSSIEFEEG